MDRGGHRGGRGDRGGRGGVGGNFGGQKSGGAPMGRGGGNGGNYRPMFIPHVPFDPVLADNCFPPVKSIPTDQEETFQAVIN